MKVFGAIVAVILIVLWLGGSFDKALAPVGLNVKDCGTNAFGATYCGDDLKSYEREVVDPINEMQGELEGEEAVYQSAYAEEEEAWCATPYSRNC